MGSSASVFHHKGLNDWRWPMEMGTQRLSIKCKPTISFHFNFNIFETKCFWGFFLSGCHEAPEPLLMKFVITIIFLRISSNSAINSIYSGVPEREKSYRNYVVTEVLRFSSRQCRPSSSKWLTIREMHTYILTINGY